MFKQNEYLHVLIFILVIFLICLLIFLFSFLIVFQDLNLEKNSIYECGFNSFDDSRTAMNIEFYLISILFIVFDLEIFFLFPWIMLLYKINLLHIFVMLLFLIVLFIGLSYEFLSDALDW